MTHGSQFMPVCDDFNKMTKSVHYVYFDDPTFHRPYRQKLDALEALEGMGITGGKIFARDYPPIFDKEKGKWETGAKQYFVMSWLAFVKYASSIPERHLKSCYEMIIGPCSLFVDIDYDLTPYAIKSNPTKNVDGATIEFIECVAILVKKLRAEGNSFFDFDFEKEVVFHTMNSNTPVKQSRHLIVRFPNNRFFKDFNHVSRFVQDAISISIERHRKNLPVDAVGGSKCNSPLMINIMEFSHEAKCKIHMVLPIVDMSVYDILRCLRAYDQQKSWYANAPDPKGVLNVKCIHHNECSYRHPYCTLTPDEVKARGIMTETEKYLSNCPTFIPLDPDTCLPVSMTIGLYKPQETDDIPRKVKGKSSTTSNKLIIKEKKFTKTTAAEFSKALDKGDMNALIAPKVIEIGKSTDPHRRMLSELDRRVNMQMGFQCELISNSDHDNGTILFGTRSKYCPYKKDEHRSNHVMISVELDCDRVHLYYKCRDDICCYDSSTGRERHQFEEVELFKSIWDDFKPILETYILNYEYPCILK